MGSRRRGIRPGLGVSQGGCSEEGTDRHLRPSLSSASYLTAPVWWSSEPLLLPPWAPFHISQDLFPTHLLSLFQHASSYFDIRRAAEYATSKYDTLVYFELQTFEEQQTQGDFSESPICLKTDPPVDELSQIPLPRSFINQRFIYLQKGDSRSTSYQTNFVTNCHISYLFS